VRRGLEKKVGDDIRPIYVANSGIQQDT